MNVSPTLTETQIARAVRAGFYKAGADPERYRELVEVIVADLTKALHPAEPDRDLNTAA